MRAAAALAQQKPAVDPARADAAIKAAFPTAPADWQSRLVPDETMRQCSAHHNSPPQGDRRSDPEAREGRRSSIRPTASSWATGRRASAWRRSGYGLRFTDYPARNPNGGNCYACHQITKQEVSYGTLGPSLLDYGKLRNFGEAEIKAAYEKIYNSQAALPCSNMPRFGANKVLTIEQIKDAGRAADEPG